ncbi:hypothetical protein NKR23_g8239 [Pleurostoma richardsiae]|uniref:SigF-like NTF2-like domain-containing protein n=1 Tax=Pleurostoma richardsiae TaxID=41990 RepID=A0AA38RJ15_9PEZI|nr:hypothetical protein NKR23_g8239 [Pleurostoma richardsiae]
MEHPVPEIKEVIYRLTTGTRDEQADTLRTYFLPDAAFGHPFCRVPSFPGNTVPLLPWLNSRELILLIYRWYRILSPHIDIKVHSAVFDEVTSTLYVNISQTFRIWFIPFYRADVWLVSALRLVALDPADAEPAAVAAKGAAAPPPLTNGDGDGRLWFVQRQEDLYPVADFARFVMPWGIASLVGVWQLWSTAACVVLAVLFAPLARVVEKVKVR